MPSFRGAERPRFRGPGTGEALSAGAKAASDPEPGCSGTFPPRLRGRGAACAAAALLSDLGGWSPERKDQSQPQPQLPQAPGCAPRLSGPGRLCGSRVGSRTSVRSQRQPLEVTAGLAHTAPVSWPGGSVTRETCPECPLRREPYPAPCLSEHSPCFPRGDGTRSLSPLLSTASLPVSTWTLLLRLPPDHRTCVHPACGA